MEIKYKFSRGQLAQWETVCFVRSGSNQPYAKSFSSANFICNICLTPRLRKMSVLQPRHWKSEKFTVVYHTTSEQKGNVARSNRFYDVTHVLRYDVILFYYPILQNSTLQPLHHQPASLTYGGAQALYVTGQDRHDTLGRVRPPRG